MTHKNLTSKKSSKDTFGHKSMFNSFRFDIYIHIYTYSLSIFSKLTRMQDYNDVH